LCDAWDSRNESLLLDNELASAALLQVGCDVAGEHLLNQPVPACPMSSELAAHAFAGGKANTSDLTHRDLRSAIGMQLSGYGQAALPSYQQAAGVGIGGQPMAPPPGCSDMHPQQSQQAALAAASQQRGVANQQLASQASVSAFPACPFARGAPMQAAALASSAAAAAIAATATTVSVSVLAGASGSCSAMPGGVAPQSLHPASSMFTMPAAPGFPSAEDGPAQKKPKKWACKECHKAKAACEGDPCRRCQRLNKQCEPQDRHSRGRFVDPPSNHLAYG